MMAIGRTCLLGMLLALWLVRFMCITQHSECALKDGGFKAVFVVVFFCFRDELLKIDFEVLTKNQSIHQSNLRRWKQKFLHAVCYQNLGGYNIRQILNKLWWYDGGALRKVILLEHLWTSIKQCQKTNSRAHTNSRRQTRQANNCCVTHSCSAMSFWMSRYEGVLDLK